MDIRLRGITNIMEYITFLDHYVRFCWNKLYNANLLVSRIGRVTFALSRLGVASRQPRRDFHATCCIIPTS